MTQSFSSEEIESIIRHNAELVHSRREGFDVDRNLLYAIFDSLDNFNSIPDNKIRILRKSAIILARITFEQPFFEGNKEIALSVTTLFLKRNGLSLPLETKQKKLDIYKLLEKTVKKFRQDRTIVSEVESFLSQRVVDLVT